MGVEQLKETGMQILSHFGYSVCIDVTKTGNHKEASIFILPLDDCSEDLKKKKDAYIKWAKNYIKTVNLFLKEKKHVTFDLKVIEIIKNKMEYLLKKLYNYKSICY